MTVIKTVTGEPVQDTIGLHGIDMNELLAFTMPVAVLGSQRLAPAFGHGTITLRHLFGIRRQIFPQRDRQDNQQQHRSQYQPAHPQGRHPGRPYHRQLTTVGQQPQANQRSQQNRHGQVFIDPPGRGGKNKLQRLPDLVIPTQRFQFVNKAEQTIEPHDDGQDGERGHQHGPPEVAFQQSHPAALRRKIRPPKYSRNTAITATRWIQAMCMYQGSEPL